MAARRPPTFRFPPGSRKGSEWLLPARGRWDFMGYHGKNWAVNEYCFEFYQYFGCSGSPVRTKEKQTSILERVPGLPPENGARDRCDLPANFANHLCAERRDSL